MPLKAAQDIKSEKRVGRDVYLQTSRFYDDEIMWLGIGGEFAIRFCVQF